MCVCPHRFFPSTSQSAVPWNPFIKSICFSCILLLCLPFHSIANHSLLALSFTYSFFTGLRYHFSFLFHFFFLYYPKINRQAENGSYHLINQNVFVISRRTKDGRKISQAAFLFVLIKGTWRLCFLINPDKKTSTFIN